MHWLRQKLSSKVVTCHSFERPRMKVAKCFEERSYYSIVLSFDKAKYRLAVALHMLQINGVALLLMRVFTVSLGLNN